MQRRQSEIDRESVKDVASRLRQFEDHNLAIKLQEEEFNHHYDRNRSERRVMGVDTRKSKEEQELEKRFALEKRLAECREIAARDEAIARQLQEQIEAEERRLKQEQDLLDQEIARRMQQRYEPPPIIPPSAYEEDERIAREMQERYMRRQRGLASAGSLDERTRSELNRNQPMSPPSTLQPRGHSDDIGPPSIPATHFPLSPTMMPSETFISPANLPPLPSYTEACTPTTPVFTNTVSSASSVRSISPVTSRILTSTAAAIQPARAPLHEIPTSSVSQNSSSSVNYSFLTSIPPVITNNNNNSLSSTTASVAAVNNEFLQNLHPSNPFKETLEAQYRAHNPESPLFRPNTNNNNAPQSEFGLPPFSDIYHSANSLSRDRPSETSSSSRLPSGAVPIMPMINAQEIRSKISDPNNM
jgi:hypothetical protein